MLKGYIQNEIFEGVYIAAENPPPPSLITTKIIGISNMPSFAPPPPYPLYVHFLPSSSLFSCIPKLWNYFPSSQSYTNIPDVFFYYQCCLNSVFLSSINLTSECSLKH